MKNTYYYDTYYHPSGIATASITIATIYNKDPDTDVIAISNENIDAIVEYFKDYAVYPYCADLTMDGQLKFKGKPVIAYIRQPAAGNGGPRTTKNSASADDIKKMFNNFYGTACDFDGDFTVYKETADA